MDELFDLLDGRYTGIVLGAIIGLVLASGRDWWRERGQARRIRIMLRIEVSQNVVALEELNRQLPRPGRDPDGPEDALSRSRRKWSEDEHRAMGLVDRPFPILHRVVWTGQIAFMPVVLDDWQIRWVSGFYANLDRLTALHDSLVAAKAASPDPDPATVKMLPPGVERLGPGSVFTQRISQTRNDIRGLLDDTIDGGNAALGLLAERSDVRKQQRKRKRYADRG